ncbi:MAG: MtnX-like HAD-IB family phosphatase [Dehalococcoidales bacterium]|nr:MtnX-like HAD-IB family phosphatase [Dehalococcoidales bacterium]
MTETTKMLVQCDFDGTVTEEDVSFMLLDTFAEGNWRERLKEYEAGRISVGRFNMEAFSMIKVGREALLEVVRRKTKVRPGFKEMVAYCRRRGIRFVIVSNGLDFYIKEIMDGLGLEDVEIFAARTHFHPGSIEVHYVGPEGNYLDDNFKGAYVNSFLGEGYCVVYMGNGTSDILASKDCHHIFATSTLLSHCERTGRECTPFTDFAEVLSVIKGWSCK